MDPKEVSETGSPQELSREEFMEALFANLVVQQSNMALMFLGKVPHPEEGKTIVDLDSAKMIIDQLEMIEVKTKGNLSKPEATLLQQTLMALRMAFVDAVNAPASDTAGTVAQPPSPSTAPPASPDPVSSSPSPIEADADSRKKFTKKY